MARHRESSPRPRRRTVRIHKRQSSGPSCLILALALVAGLAAVPTVLILAAWRLA